MPMTDKETHRLIEEKETRERVKRLNAVITKVLAGMKPPDDLTVTEWAEKNRRLSTEASAEPGPWRTDRTPYLREPMDAFTDPRVHRIVMVAASQVGKSEFLNNTIGYIIDEDPGSILFVHPTTIDAKEYSKLRIAPMIRDCPTLKKKVADPKSRDSGNTILQKTYPGGILTMCGSTEAHALAALADCRADFAEGAVGAGRGMRCHGLKGGIGSASRVVELDGKNYCLGALVLSNHARFDDLILAGVSIRERLAAVQPRIAPHQDRGSIITVLATDIPLTCRQLGRVARRAIVGLSRTGSYCGNGSGEIVIAFSTGCRIPHYPQGDLLPLQAIHEDRIDRLFRAAAECVEESVLSSLLHAETVTGRGGLTVRGLPDLLKGEC